MVDYFGPRENLSIVWPADLSLCSGSGRLQRQQQLLVFDKNRRFVYRHLFVFFILAYSYTRVVYINLRELDNFK